MAIFGLAFSLPLIAAVFWGRARDWLDRLALLSNRIPFWTGVVFLLLGGVVHLLRGDGMTGAMNEMPHRSAEEVLQDHLRESRSGSVEDDLKRNYAEEVVLLTGRGLYRGHDGVRELNRILVEELPNARFEYQTSLVYGEMGFLEWTAEGDGARVEDGADSYLIRGGRVVVQTIHYTVQRD